jgi:uncharacterized protein YxeA
MKKIILTLTATLLLISITTFSQRQQIGTSSTYWEVSNDPSSAEFVIPP